MSAPPIRILGISGSLRAASYNTALLRAAAAVMPQAMSMEIAEIGDLPLYNGDVERRGFPGAVQRLRTEVAAADAVLFACPEYNWSITGALKNAIDWLSRNPASPLDHKPAAIVGGGGRGGGARAQSHLRDVLAHNRVQVFEESEVVVPRVWGAFDDDLRVTDERVWADMRVLVEGFRDDVQRDIAHRPALLAVAADVAALAAVYRRLIADYRVVVAGGRDEVARQIERWAPVAVLADADAGSVDAGALPVIALTDPETLPDVLRETLSR